MKKIRITPLSPGGDWANKMLLTMKLTIIILFLSLMQVSATVYSQATKFTFDAENKQVVDVLREIEDNSQFRFFYLREQVDVERRVSVKANDATVEQILDELFKETGINYELMNDFLIVLKKGGSSLEINRLSNSSFMQQQQPAVSGTVTDESGQPLPGVTVVIKGTTRGTVTNADGNYSLTNTPEDATLVFSFVGMRTQEVVVGNQTSINISMEEETIGMDEVVVVGYGVQQRRDITGSISSVKADEIIEIPVSTLAESLQGKVSGMQITQSNGRPGGKGIDILIRGQNSLSANNAPLIVVDGMAISGTNFENINMNDIQSVEVLKDASSAAIYGSRGSNGVILITTKSGTKGDLKVNYHGYIGPIQLTQKIELFDGPEWITLRREASRAAGMPTNDEAIFDSKMLESIRKNDFYDYQDMALQSGLKQDHYISISGGNEKIQTLIGAGYNNEEGIIPYSNFKRGTFRLNLDYSPIEKLKVATRMQFSRTNQDLRGTGSAINALLLTPPVSQPYDESGNLQLYPTDDQTGPSYNPLYELENRLDDQIESRFLGNIKLSYNIFKNLTYSLNIGVDHSSLKQGIFNTEDTREAISSATINKILRDNLLIENILNYQKSFNENNKFDATLLYSWQVDNNEFLGITTRDLPTELLGYEALNGSDVRAPQRNITDWKLESYMGRINYSLKDKYLLTATARIDGSSKFGAATKYGFFPSLALGWRIKNEEFLSSVSSLQDLKIRVSYGTVGNQEIPIYQSLARTGLTNYYFGNHDPLQGFTTVSMSNPDLKWEVTSSLNLGVDFSVLDGRIYGSADLFKSNTDDLLLEQKILATNGFTSVLNNVGSTKTNGFDLNLNGLIIHNDDLTWNVAFNMASSKSIIVALSGETDEDGNPVNNIANRWFIGEPIGVNYDYEFGGIWQLTDDIANSHQPAAEPGEIKVVDQNGDGVISSTDDRIILGDEQPSWFGGITNNFKYKGFELNIFINTVQGVQRSNTMLAGQLGNMTARTNHLKVNYWTPENPTNEWFGAFRSDTHTTPFQSSISYQDASYIALRNVTLAYSLPNSILNKLKMSQLKIYVSGYNLKYWTDWIGYSPEYQQGQYPIAKSYVIGVNIGL